ncbi:MAG: CinA family protein [Zoogloeaceae bacterium]|jgi:nicotinamide-nucleotide amidase|nr:CinA family protein [Zoogloeaceae bacterium]
MDTLLTPAALTALAEAVGAALVARGTRLATAESCTGGWVAQTLTAQAGASVWFDCGFVVYSNEAKTRLLKISAALLKREGAVSEAVAREMALGTLRCSRAGIALAVTGIAGPSGGTPEKPVGTVCFGWGWKKTDANGKEILEAQVMTRHFAGDREAIRRQSVACALCGVLEILRETADTSAIIPTGRK